MSIWEPLPRRDVPAAQPQPALPAPPSVPAHPLYALRTPDMAAQVEMKAHARAAWGRGTGAANFSEQGLGKSKAAIDLAGEEWAAGRVGAVLLVSINNVHRQWAEEQVPEHLGEAVPRRVSCWRGKPPAGDWLAPGPELHWFCVSYDSLTTKHGEAAVAAFMRRHAVPGVLLIVDESHYAKNPGAFRTKAVRKLARAARRVLLLTGTPIGRRLEDEWAQLRMLAPAPLGHTSVTAFRAEYCVMGGWEAKQVVGHRNVDRFNALAAPLVFRGTKDAYLDLPPKSYRRWAFDLEPETRRAYDELKKNFLVQLDDAHFTVANAAALIVRLQQLARGELVGEGGAAREMPDAALPELLRRLDTLPEGAPVLVWARFRRDVARVRESLGRDGATWIDGGVPAGERGERARSWLRGDVRFLIANPAAAGTGLNLQGSCNHVVYYSCGWDSIQRQQSEDRTHRIGTRGTVTYYDMVARRTVDEAVLQRLRSNQDLAALALGDVRAVVEGDGA